MIEISCGVFSDIVLVDRGNYVQTFSTTSVQGKYADP